MFSLGVFITALVAMTTALYTSSDDVVELNESNFHDLVVSSDSLWLVEFYAPWCGHCKSLAPEWRKAATALLGVVKVGAVDADVHKSLGGKYGVRGFPTIKVFGIDKMKPEDYKGGREARSIVSGAMSQAQAMVTERLSGGGKTGGRGDQRRGGDGGGGSQGGGEKDVIELTDSNFDDLVFNSDEMWLVEFYAPWCGHCKSLAPHWAKAASNLKGKVKVAALDATVHTVVASKFGIQGFPTIKMFPAGQKSGPQDAVEYDGPRESAGIIQWAMDRMAANLPPPEIKEITNPEDFSAACENQQLCIIAFLPIIYDCQAKCRNDYIEMLQELGDKYKKEIGGWLWTEATTQPELETAVGIGGFGYPAMIGLNAKKEKYMLFKGSFGKDGIRDFLRTIAAGSRGSYKLPNDKKLKIISVDPWDGKDKELPEEEEDDFEDKDEL